MSNQLDATIAKRFDITVKQNQTFNAAITLLDDNGGAINLGGATVKMSIRQQDCGCTVGCNGDNDFNFNFKYRQDMTPAIGGGSNNVLTFFDVVQLEEGVYKYDLLVKYSNTLQQYLLTGNFRVKKSYTSI